MFETAILPAEYAAARPALFPSQTSFQWFVRTHREELVRRGAVLMPTGRLLVDPATFDQFVREIGSRRASLPSLCKV